MEIKIILKRNTTVYRFVDGEYKNSKWLYLIITENNVLLENLEETILLAAGVSFVQIDSKGILDKIYEITKNPEVYISGLNAISQGSEREILEKLLS